jgi:predicted nuclease with TOPRIM domain
VEAARADAAAERERNTNTLEQEKARAEAERRIWQEQLEAAQRRFDEKNNSLQGEVERLREETTALQEALEIVGVVGE